MASRSAISPDAAWLCDRRQSEPDHVKPGTALSPGCPTTTGAHTEFVSLRVRQADPPQVGFDELATGAHLTAEPNQTIEFDIDAGLDQIEMDPVLHHFRR